MVFINLGVLVLCTNLALALDGLNETVFFQFDIGVWYPTMYQLHFTLS